jgi:hypothetical protein
VRTGIELVVLVIGWILGGNVGVGTVLFAALVGPLCNWTMPLFAIPRTTNRGGPAEQLLEGTATPSTPVLDSPAN